MADELVLYNLYNSELTGPELDEALRNLAQLESTAAQVQKDAAQANTAKTEAQTAAGQANTAKTEAQTAATNAEDSADAAADSAQQAAIEAQKALGFRSYFGGQVVPDTDGDLDPSRPMSTPTAASVTIKARGDRIAGLTMAGKTTQAGTGDPSPENIRPITGVGVYDRCVIIDGDSNISWVSGNYPYADVFTGEPYAAEEVTLAKGSYLKAVTAILNTNSVGFLVFAVTAGTIRLRLPSDVEQSLKGYKAYFSKHPLTIWYKSKGYAKSTGPFYTVVELSDDPYRAVGFELNQPLFDGDSLKVGGKSGCDQMIVLDGSEDENWVVAPISSDENRYAIKGVVPVPPKTAGSVWATEGFSNLYPFIPISVTSKPGVGIGGEYVYIADKSSFLNVEELKAYLSINPLTIFYKSVSYTEEADIPVALEKHTGSYLIFDGTEVVTVTTSGSTTPYLQIAGVADNHNSSHRLVSSVAPFTYSYGGAGAFTDYGNIVFGKVWCQSNGFANTETMVEDFKSFLTAQYSAGTPVQVVYELAAPVSYARPVPTMIAQPGEDGTFTVTGENRLSVRLKAFQDGGDAATIEGHTWADILAAIQAAIATTAQALMEEKTNV